MRLYRICRRQRATLRLYRICRRQPATLRLADRARPLVSAKLLRRSSLTVDNRTMSKPRLTGQGWDPARLLNTALLLGVALCGAGVVWDRLLAPGMDDSDPSTYIGLGLLLFGAPALILALVGLATRRLSHIWAGRTSVGLGLAALNLELLALIGLLGWGLLLII